MFCSQTFSVLIVVSIIQLNSVHCNVSCETAFREPGFCIPIKDCPSLLNLQSSYDFFNQMVLRQSHCEGSQSNMVCCADEPKRSSIERSTTPRITTRTTTTKTTAKSTTTRTATRFIYIRTHNNNETSLIPTPGSGQCGMQVVDKIIGGNITAINEFPWMALLEYTKENDSKCFRCGGSLINDRYVLTAAHCITTSPRLTGVRLGEWNYTSARDCEIFGITTRCSDPPQNFEIEETKIHPGYRNCEMPPDDIALIRLSKRAKLSPYVQPICLPSSQTLQERSELTDIQFIVSGWGCTEASVFSDVKLKVDVKGLTLSKCRRFFSTVNENQICAGAEAGKDSCYGDSGGPLMATHTDEQGCSYWYIAGAVSYGGRNGCGRDGVPSVYTRVDRYLSWIEDTVRE